MFLPDPSTHAPMPSKLGRAFHAGTALALLLFLVAGAMAYQSTSRWLDLDKRIARTQQVFAQLVALEGTLNETQVGLRIYVDSGEEQNLARLFQARAETPKILSALQSSISGEAVQEALFQQLDPAIKTQFALWDETVSKRKTEGLASANHLMSLEVLQAIGENRNIVAAMFQEETRLLGTTSLGASTFARRAALIQVLLAAMALGILVIAFVVVQTDVNQKAKAIEIQRETEKKLGFALRESETRSREITQLSTLGDLLQSCETFEEACVITSSVLPTLFGSNPGILAMTCSSRNAVETVAAWNDCSSSEQVFGPEDCWALRRGKIHAVSDSGPALKCAHVGSSLTTGYVCVPLAAQGETLGVLYVENPGRRTPGDARRSESEDVQRLAVALGERISLAFANLKLREILRNQSIRDSLTGLFNRRYMEESLARELHRAARKKRNLALIMVDLDHFKRFNDTFGHQAGDLLLREAAGILKSRVRAGDTACRYGGEEFALILSETDANGAILCMEQIRTEINRLQIHHRGQALGAVTLSAGVAVFPEHGENPEQLIRAADQALYRAKSEGRDRVTIMSPVPA